MAEAFLSISKSTWDVIFMVLRYGVAALALAYLTSVVVKQRGNLIDVKGRILEQRIDSYKEIHHWTMRLKSLIASPAQKEQYYQYFLDVCKFRTGYQGLEYCSFFHTPVKLVQFGLDLNKLVEKSTIHLDYTLENKLTEFQWWMDDVIVLSGAFAETEANPVWRMSKQRQDRNNELATQLLGIALQEDINAFHLQLDRMLRDRLQKIRLSSIRSDSFMIRLKHKLSDACQARMNKKGKGKARLVRWFYNHCLYRTYGCSQLRKRAGDVLSLLTVAHFSEEITSQKFRNQSPDLFHKQMMDYERCLQKNIAIAYQKLYD